jgi:hypothetical protein
MSCVGHTLTQKVGNILAPPDTNLRTPMNTEPVQIPQETKPRRVVARLSEQEYQAYLVVVQSLSTTRSRLIRKLIRELVGVGPDLLADDMKSLSNGIYQLGALGRNLNQMLRAMHSGQLAGQTADFELVKGVREEVLILQAEWLEAINRSKTRLVTP